MTETKPTDDDDDDDDDDKRGSTKRKLDRLVPVKMVHAWNGLYFVAK